MKTRRVMVDFPAVWDALDDKRGDLSWVEVSKILETSDSQLAAMKWSNNGISSHTLLAAMVWLGRDLRDFVKPSAAE
jgi:hypothetical protein